MNALLSTELEELYEEMSEVSVNENEANALKERFRINDLNGANWIFRKIKALQEKANENNALAESEKNRISNWLASQNSVAEKDIEFFEALVIEYFIAERTKDPKFKLSTPYGKVSTRKGDKWNYDEDALTKSLKASGLIDYIKVVETPRKDEIKKDKATFNVTEAGVLVTTNGEVIDGVIVTKSESVSVKVE